MEKEYKPKLIGCLFDGITGQTIAEDAWVCPNCDTVFVTKFGKDTNECPSCKVKLNWDTSEN